MSQADAASTATALQKSQEQLTEMTILRDACVTHCKEVQASSEQQAAELQTQLEAVQGQLTTSAAKHDAEMTAVKNQVGSLQAAKEALQVQLHGVKVSKPLVLYALYSSSEMCQTQRAVVQDTWQGGFAHATWW